MDAIDFLSADRFSALGETPLLIVEAATHGASAVPVQAVIVGIDRDGRLPPVDPDHFDLLLTTTPGAPAPWVTIAPDRFDAALAGLEEAVRRTPLAATILAQVLRIGVKLPALDAIGMESLAYSTLLGGSEFARWQGLNRAAALPEATGELVRVARHGDAVTLTLDSPATRNAMTAAMRDALYDALANVLDDPSEPTVLLRGAGKCFSTGGDLGEFGTAHDLAQAHAVRTVRGCAGLLLQLGARATVRFHGACIGSGLEVGAAAARREAAPESWFQLPELAMGLIPGAGGSVTVARAVGRHRTCWMVLSGSRISAGQALAWGLIDSISSDA